MPLYQLCPFGIDLDEECSASQKDMAIRPSPNADRSSHRLSEHTVGRAGDLAEWDLTHMTFVI